MQFLKTLFWVAVAVALALFGKANWKPVTLKLWGGLEADIKLPVLILTAFLLGLIPMLLFHRARLWTMRRRIEAVERQAAVTVAPTTNSPAPSSAPAHTAGEEPAAI